MSTLPLLARGIVQYGRGREAPEILRGVNLDVAEGLTALVGPNGSGKTTLLRTLAGLLPPWEGHVEVGGVALQDDAAAVRRRVGYLPQFPGVFRRLTVREHFERQRLWVDGAGERSPAAALEHFGLSAWQDAPAAALTPSRRRWLALALMWARHAQVLLLDEPTAGLDLEDRLVFWERMLDLLHDARSIRAIVVTTHLLDEVERYCRHVVMLAGGRAVFQGTVAKLRERGRDRAFFGQPSGWPPDAVEVGVDLHSGHRLGLALAGPPPPELPLRVPQLVDGYLLLEREWTRVGASS